MYAAAHAPVAPFTWEVQAELARTQQETGRLPLRWNRPVEIVGFFATVVALNDDGGLLGPTTDDIQCAIGANQEERFTNRLEDAAATALEESFVTLSALSVEVPRLVRIQLTNAGPQMDVAFRWKNHNPIASPRFEDALISLALYCRYIT
jgi:hypothetical protein